jgi:nucleoside-diphosphate-sugar epimerase
MKRSGSKVLMTGASGFIGANVVRYLSEKGYSVLGTTRRKGGPGPLVEDYLGGDKDSITWITVDLRDSERVMNIAEDHNIGGIIHAAVFTPASRELEQTRSRDILESNIMGTVNTLELAKEAGVDRYVYVSSSGVYGSTGDPTEPVPETSPAPYLQSSGFYRTTKIACERLTEHYGRLFPMTTTSMRVGAPYGCMERPTASRQRMGPIYRFLELILTEKRKKLRVKELDYTRDWTFAMDTASCLVAGLETPPPISPLYNVSCGVNSSLREILRAIQEAPGVNFEWEEVGDDEDADFPDSVGIRRGPLNIEKARRELGFQPRYDLNRGIRAYVDWWKSVTEKGLWSDNPIS